jgi:Tol biopolymer transport system component
MGEVYRARDTRLKRDVALKVLVGAVAEDSGRFRRFQTEAESTAALSHPNIVAVYDIGQENSAPFIVSELVSGGTLTSLLARGPLPVRKLLDLAIPVAEGLAAAHAQGIVHRDLKPDNILLTADGSPKIADFGLAKYFRPSQDAESSQLMTLTDDQTKEGTIVGTVSYMSPEQAKGEPVDFRSDQFSFGSLLYEMATGTRAFRKATAVQTLAAIVQEEPEPIAMLSPNVPAPLRWAIEQCLAKEARSRYASTEDLARDLARIRDHLSEASISVEAIAAAPTSPRRRSGYVVAAAALLALLGGIFTLGKRTGDRPFPSFQRLTFRRGTVRSARFASDGRTVIYGAAWDGDPIRLFSTRTEGRESSRFELPDADLASVSSTGEAAILLNRPFTTEPWAGTLARVPLAGGAPREIVDRVGDADWSADGGSLAILRKVGERWRIEFPIGKVLHETSDEVVCLRISPKGDRIALIVWTEKGFSVEVVDLAGKRTRLSSGWMWGGPSAAWSPDGSEIWFSANEAGWVNPIRAVNLSGKQRLVMRLPGWLTVRDISQDGRVLLTISTLRSQMFGQAPGESQERNLSWHEGSFARDITPDGKTLLFEEKGEGSSGANTVYVRGTDGSPAKRLGLGGAEAISPDGRWAAVHQERPTQLVLLPTGAGESRVLDGEGKEYVSAAWFRDGKRMLVNARVPGHAARAYVQDFPTGRLRPITPEGTECGAVSPDGSEVLCTGPDGGTFPGSGRTLRYPVEAGSPRPVPGLGPGDKPWQWTEDGRSLFIARREEGPTRVWRVFRQNVATGKRELWREFAPPDRAGLVGGTIIFTPDGRAYARSYFYLPSDLYLVTGLR